MRFCCGVFERLLRFCLFLVLAAAFLSCVRCHAPKQRSQVIARLHHPLAGARLCSHDTEHSGFIELNLESDWRDATISVVIDDISVLTFVGVRRDVDAGFPFLSFPLLSAEKSQQGSHSLRVEVFNEMGEDLQPEIMSTGCLIFRYTRASLLQTSCLLVRL